MVVGKLADKVEAEFTEDAFTRQQVMDKLTHWTQHLIALGRSNCVLTVPEIRREIDKWLEELAAVAEIRWMGNVDDYVGEPSFE